MATLKQRPRHFCSVGDANNTTSRSGAGVTSLQRLLVAALTQVVGATVDNHRSANDRVGTKQLHQKVLSGALGHARSVGGDVAQVANVSVVVLWGTVGLGEGVEVRASRGATVGVVTKLVDVHASQRVGIIARDVPRDGGWVVFVFLFEVDNSANLRISSDNSNWPLVWNWN